MALLSANATIVPRHIGGSVDTTFNYKATGADIFYLGAVICHASGKALCTNADATFPLGFFLGQPPGGGVTGGAPYTVTAADQPLAVHVSGIWWVSGNAVFADANLLLAVAETAGSDNPADIIAQTTGTTGTLGLIVHVDVTGTSCAINIDWKVVPVNA